MRNPVVRVLTPPPYTCIFNVINLPKKRENTINKVTKLHYRVAEWKSDIATAYNEDCVSLKILSIQTETQ